jgi:hypothetical protein
MKQYLCLIIMFISTNAFGTSHFINVPGTGYSSSYSGKVFLLGQSAIDNTDEIGVFIKNAGNELLIGACIFGETTSAYYYVNVYGDDPLTTDKEGASLNDTMIFKVWDADQETEHVILWDNMSFESYAPLSQPDIPPKFSGSQAFGLLNLTVNEATPVTLYQLTINTQGSGSGSLSITNISVSTGQTMTMNDLYLSIPDLKANHLPDWWEQSYTNVGLATNDDDHDGYSNRFEYENRTNPFEKDAAYYFRGYSETTDTRTRMLTLFSSPGMPVATLGDAFQFQLLLQKTEDLEMNVPLQLFVHFDSSVLQFSHLNSLVAEPSGYTIKNEQESQTDNNPNTDRVIEIKWPQNQLQSINIYPESICSLAYTVSNLNGSKSDDIITSIHFSTTTNYTCDTYSVSIKNIDFTYDIDGNGKADALTDGLLLLHYMADSTAVYTKIFPP